MTDPIVPVNRRPATPPLSRLWLALCYALLVVLTVVWLLPMLYSFTTSAKTPTEIAYSGFSLLPANWVAENYLALFEGASQYPVLRWFANSLVMSTGHAVLMVVIVSLAGYGYTRLRFPGRDALFLAILAVTLFPSVVNLIPSYKITQVLGWVNTPWAIIVPGVAGAANVFLVRSFMSGIPRELDEAARIDGAGNVAIFGRIILPMIRPILIVIFLFAFTGAWNDFLWPTIVFNDINKMPITAGLQLLQNMFGDYMKLGQLMASAVLAMIPTTALFVVAQRYFIGSLNLTAGLKG
ncbi:MAG: carbohydrate ABC transporter permease [Salana multivorans]|uniref:carbohydrate ABC transporter permease n=1 Tax=Salana multivorans TaxID=120377 RepID=UPI0009590FE9|nr:carbohydrate ABC transporter permease [Salana multivorans]MBN8882030.1 carbohydrate ABC transporter permease [Salana multivorans]OJX95953.1 MAG: ABC transporter permease [Micrococcales bacterium 73-15]